MVPRVQHNIRYCGRTLIISDSEPFGTFRPRLHLHWTPTTIHKWHDMIEIQHLFDSLMTNLPPFGRIKCRMCRTVSSFDNLADKYYSEGDEISSSNNNNMRTRGDPKPKNKRISHAHKPHPAKSGANGIWPASVLDERTPRSLWSMRRRRRRWWLYYMTIVVRVFNGDFIGFRPNSKSTRIPFVINI